MTRLQMSMAKRFQKKGTMYLWSEDKTNVAMAVSRALPNHVAVTLFDPPQRIDGIFEPVRAMVVWVGDYIEFGPRRRFIP